jgi:hypothetical protein
MSLGYITSFFISSNKNLSQYLITNFICLFLLLLIETYDFFANASFFLLKTHIGLDLKQSI